MSRDKIINACKYMERKGGSLSVIVTGSENGFIAKILDSGKVIKETDIYPTNRIARYQGDQLAKVLYRERNQ